MFNKIVTVLGGLGIIGTVSLGGFHAIKPLEDSEFPAAGITRVDGVDKKVAQLSAQSDARFTKLQKSIDIQQQALQANQAQTTTLVKQGVTNDLQYWQTQHDVALLRLKKNPNDPAALGLKEASEKQIGLITQQLAK